MSFQLQYTKLYPDYMRNTIDSPKYCLLVWGDSLKPIHYNSTCREVDHMLSRLDINITRIVIESSYLDTIINENGEFEDIYFDVPKETLDYFSKGIEDLVEID